MSILLSKLIRKTKKEKEIIKVQIHLKFLLEISIESSYKTLY
jgi:hypothetical protein